MRAPDDIGERTGRAPRVEPAAGDRPVRPRLTLGELIAIVFCGFTLQSAIVLSGYWQPAQLAALLGHWQLLVPPSRPALPREIAIDPATRFEPGPSVPAEAGAPPAMERRAPRRPLRRPPEQKSRLQQPPVRA